MNKIVVSKAIKRSIPGHLILCGLLGLSGTIQAAAPAQQPDDTLANYGYPLQAAPHDVPPITQEAYLNIENEHKAGAAASLPLNQLLIPANGQCLYTTIIMGYLLPVKQEAAKLNARIAQLFGCLPPYYLNQLHQTLQNPIHYLTSLHSDAFSTLVTAFMARMQIKKGAWGGAQEIQTIANKLSVNIQAHYPDPNNPTNLVQSDLTKPAKVTANITLHIVQDKVHPAEVLTQTEGASAKDNPYYQHYRLKYKLPSPIPMPVLPSTQSSMSHNIGSQQEGVIPPYLVAWFEAAKTGNRKWLGSLYSNYNINVNDRNEDNYTALMKSAEKGQLACVKYLVQQGADINTRAKNKYTALLVSAYKGYLDCVKFLLQQGADINTKAKDGYTALLLSAYKGHLDCVKFLLRQGANVNTRAKDGYTALLLSARLGHFDCVKYLLQQGADINDKNKYGNTALLLTAKKGHLNCVKLLLQLGADINTRDKDGDTALLRSVHEGHLDCVKFLLQQGADVTLKDKYHRTALESAKEAGKHNVVNYLSNYSIALQKWFNAAENGNRKLLEALYNNYNINVNTKDKNEYTALICSVQQGHLDCVKYLVEQGADINAKNKWKNTALVWSARLGYLDCVKFLVQQGADVTLKGEQNKTALGWAKEAEKDDVVNYLSNLADNKESMDID